MALNKQKTHSNQVLNKTIKYPQVKVRLVGEDGNAFAILARVQLAMRTAGLKTNQIKEFLNQATSSDYNHLLSTVMAYCSVDTDFDNYEEDDYE